MTSRPTNSSWPDICWRATCPHEQRFWIEIRNLVARVTLANRCLSNVALMAPEGKISAFDHILQMQAIDLGSREINEGSIALQLNSGKETQSGHHCIDQSALMSCA